MRMLLALVLATSSANAFSAAAGAAGASAGAAAAIIFLVDVPYKQCKKVCKDDNGYYELGDKGDRNAIVHRCRKKCRDEQ